MARNRRIIAGRPAMITGAASGIGRSLARRLSRSGAPVAIADVQRAEIGKGGAELAAAAAAATAGHRAPARPRSAAG